jgi:TonB family protein
MKNPLLPLVCTALLLVIPAGAQMDPNPGDQSSLQIIRTVEPHFPLALLHGPVLNGNARVAIDVDENGKLVDVLVTGYSRKEFADTTVELVRQWQYVPPLHRGRPWSSIRELRFDFSRSGVVVNFTGAEAMLNRMDELLQGIYVYRTHALRELDRIPTPIHVVNPVTPTPGPHARYKQTVNVEFYIDEQGQVRLPAVSRDEAGSVYAASALDAVRQWRFAPPTVKGRPVLVLATQQFNFVPKN